MPNIRMSQFVSFYKLSPAVFEQYSTSKSLPLLVNPQLVRKARAVIPWTASSARRTIQTIEKGLTSRSLKKKTQMLFGNQ